MEAIRKIVTVKDNTIRVTVPDSYNNTQVELIILSTEELPSQVQEESVDYYSKFFGAIQSGLSEEETAKKLQSLRDEWNRDIS